MNPVNLDQLRAFLFVVRLGGVGKAAEGLHLTQPAITARIRNLEERMGTPLFDRSAGAMKLTKRGERLFVLAERFEHLASVVERDVMNPDAIEGRLRLGVSETIAQCWLPDLIYKLHSRFPRIEIEFNVDISVNLRTALLERSLDLAILLGPVSEYAVSNIDLPGFDLAWYTACSAPAPETSQAYFKRPVLTYARQTRPFHELKALLFDEVGSDVALFPSSSLLACFKLVEADLGVAALPRALGQDYVNRGTIREFDPGWIPEPLHFTASFINEPQSTVTQAAAHLALETAVEFIA